MTTRELGGAPPTVTGPFRDWVRLEGVVLRSRCRRGTLAYRAGDPADALFLLKSGKVKIGRADGDGKALILQILVPGDLFGEMALLGETHRPSSVEVLEEAAFWVIPRKSVLEWLQPRPEAWQILAGLLGRRLQAVEAAIERFRFWDVEQRVIHLLLELAQQHGEPVVDGIHLKLQISQKELAQLVGSTRETTSSILNRLGKRGVLRIKRRRLTISSMAELAAIGQAAALVPRRPPGAEEAGRGAVAGQSEAG